MIKTKIAVIVVVAGLIGGAMWIVLGHNNKSSSTQAKKAATVTQESKKTMPVNHCASNSDGGKLILIDTAQRHLWACAGASQAYDSPVITGYDKLAADITPTGTYKIYAKTTDTALRGSDSTGSWNDPVSYWMPFLDNQYGTYGFHDATWRADSAFGNVSTSVSPDLPNGASHGCIELPLATAKWLYNWAPVGTVLTIT